MPTSTLPSAALDWWRDHKIQARDEYAQILEEGWSIQETGIHVLTAKGEGFLRCVSVLCSKVRGCIEVKCPYIVIQSMKHAQCNSSSARRMKTIK